MLYLMQWLGMRYIEVIKARASLRGPTLKVDLIRNWVSIWGTGRGGLSKQRGLPLTPQVARKLRRYLKWRQDRGISSPWLFVNSYGRPWSEQSWAFNKTIRGVRLPWYNKWVRSQGNPEAAFNRYEVRLMTTHRMGRHVFGTVYTPHLPRKTMMEVMGVVHYDIVNRYVNFSRSGRVGQFLNATPAVLATRCSRRMRFLAPLGGAISGWPGEAFEALPKRARPSPRGNQVGASSGLSSPSR